LRGANRNASPDSGERACDEDHAHWPSRFSSCDSAGRRRNGARGLR
jgi:hypothetical protein